MAGVFGNPKLSRNLEISLDSPFVVFYGDHHEASPVELAGAIVLNSGDHMNIRSVKIKLEGRWKVSWSVSGSVALAMGVNSSGGQAMVKDSGKLVEDEQIIFPTTAGTTPLLSAMSTTHRLGPGRYEWRFKFTLDPSLPESVEGLHSGHVVYDLTAEIDRGYMSKGLLAKKHVRIIRTLSRDMTETVPFPYSNEDTWTDKLKYKIYIPSRYYVFGTSIPVEFTLFPMRKGVRIGKIKMEVLERVGLESSRQPNDQTFATTLADKVVANVEQKHLPQERQQMVEPTTGIADDSYHFKVVLPLKKSLNSCRQSVNTPHIKIHHNLKIYVNIHNPDGHVSQLCLRNLIHIYVSPHLHINDDQSVSTGLPAVQPTLNGDVDGDLYMDAPPTYGTHILDQLYQDIDTSGFYSGFATPMPFLGSRNGSSDNLFMFPGHDDGGFGLGVANGDPHSGEVSSRSSSSVPETAAMQLQSRLAALEARRPSIASIVDVPSLDFSAQNSPRLIPADNNLSTSPTPSLATSPPPQIAEFPPTPLSRMTNPPLQAIAAGNRSRSHSTRNSISMSQSGSPLPTPPLASETQSSAFPSLGGQSSGLRITQNRSSPPASFDLTALQRTPSYATAIRSPVQHVAFETAGTVLPTYEEVEEEISRSRRPSLAQPPLTQPVVESPDSVPANASTGPVTVFDSNTVADRLRLLEQTSELRRPHSQQFLTVPNNGGSLLTRPAVGNLLAPPQRAHVRGRSLGRVSDIASSPTSNIRRVSPSHLRSEIRPSPVDETAPEPDFDTAILQLTSVVAPGAESISPAENMTGLARYIRPTMGGGSLASLWARRGSH